MHIIFLSGGSGKRLWPLSNEVRSKQFLKIFTNEQGARESMIQRMYRMVQEENPDSTVTIATSANQVSPIVSQLGQKVNICVEPCRRDTFPAIALATSYLHDELKIDEREVVVVCPVDPAVERDYFAQLSQCVAQAQKAQADLVLMGMTPTCPSEKYGYIIPADKQAVSRVVSFKEKPNRCVAEQYIAQGALWNGGVFAYRLKYVLDEAKKLLGTSDYKQLLARYASLPKISFDYAVVEKAKNVQVMRFGGSWKDLGTWDTLTQAMKEPVQGNAVMAGCTDTHIINELQIPLVALGVSGVVVAATPDGILVIDKKESDKLKEYVVSQRPMCEKRVWGEYRVLDYRRQANGNNSLTKHLTIFPGRHISYQTHEHRCEMWTVTEGMGKLILEGKITPLSRGDMVLIKPGMKHAVKADTQLQIIEVQLGEELTEEDIQRLDWDWQRVE